jgi:hypothetical protein
MAEREPIPAEQVEHWADQLNGMREPMSDEATKRIATIVEEMYRAARAARRGKRRGKRRGGP